MATPHNGSAAKRQPLGLLTVVFLAALMIFSTMLLLSPGDSRPRTTWISSSTVDNHQPARVTGTPARSRMPPRAELSADEVMFLLVQPQGPNLYDFLLADVQHWAAQAIVARNWGTAYSAPNKEKAVRHLAETLTLPQWVAVVGAGTLVRQWMNLSTLLRTPVPMLSAQEYDALTVSGPGNPDEAAIFLVNVRSNRTKEVLQSILETNKTVTRGAMDLALGLHQNFEAKGALVGDIVAAYSSSCHPMTTRQDQITEASFQILYTRIAPVQRYLGLDCEANKRSFFRYAWTEFDAFLPNHAPVSTSATTVTLVSLEDTKWFRGAMLWRLIHWTSLLHYATRWDYPTLNAYNPTVLPAMLKSELPAEATKWVAFFSVNKFITSFDEPLAKHIDAAQERDKAVAVVVVDGSVLVRWDDKGVALLEDTFPLRGEFYEILVSTAKKNSLVVVDLSESAKLCDVLRRMPPRPKAKNIGVLRRWEWNYMIPDEARKRLAATSGAPRFALFNSLRFNQKPIIANSSSKVGSKQGGDDDNGMINATDSNVTVAGSSGAPMSPEPSFGGQVTGATKRRVAIAVDYREACKMSDNKTETHYTKISLDYHMWATRAYAAEFGFEFRSLACGASITFDSWLKNSLRKDFDCVVSVAPNVFLRHESELIPKIVASGRPGEGNTSPERVGVKIGCRSDLNDKTNSLTDISQWSLGETDSIKLNSVAMQFPTLPCCTPGSAKMVLAVKTISRNCNPAFYALADFAKESLPRGDALATIVDPNDANIDGAQVMASMKPLSTAWASIQSAGPEKKSQPGETAPTAARGSRRRFAILNVFSDPRRDLEKVSMWTTSRWNKQQYAAKHGYDYIVENADVVKPPYRTAHWAKMTAVAKYLHRYDWIWVADMDTVVTNASITLDSIVDAAIERNAGVEPGFLAVAEVNHINSGSLMFRNTQRTYQFLRSLLISVPVRQWMFFEQTAFAVALHRPEFSGGLVKQLVTSQVGSSELEKVLGDLAAPSASPLPGAPGFTVLMGGKYLNAYPSGWAVPGTEWTPGSFLIHFPGYKDGVDTTLFSEFIEKAVEMNPGFTRLPEFR